MNNIERLNIELEKAEKELEQNTFYVSWLKGAIKAEEIKELIDERSSKE